MAAPDYKFSGYGTLGYQQADKYDDLVFRRDITQRADKLQDNGWLVDSRLGFQLDLAINERWDSVVQLLIKEQPEFSLANSLDIAFVHYHPSDRWGAYVGRVPLNIYLLSDHRNVGYSYHWVRPPVEFYGWMAFSNMDGAKAYVNFGDWENSTRFELFVGRAKEYLAFGIESDEARVESELIWGGGVEWQSGNIKLRMQLLDAEFRDEQSGISILKESQQPIAAIWPQINELISDMELEDKHFHYGGIGFEWQLKPWLVQAEISQIEEPSRLSFSGRRFYLSVGRRWDDWFPFITWSRSWDDRKFDYEAPPNGAGLDGIYESLERASQSFIINQYTFSLGVRWDIASKKAFKFQCDRSSLSENSLGLYVSPDNQIGSVRRTWCSTTFDWVF